MEQLEHLSFKGQKALFARLEELARIANMNKKERDEYEACLKVYRDNYSIALYRKRQEEAKFQEGLQSKTVYLSNKLNYVQVWLTKKYRICNLK